MLYQEYLIEQYYIYLDEIHRPERDHLMFKYRFGILDGRMHPYQEIGLAWKISRERARQLTCRMVNDIEKLSSVAPAPVLSNCVIPDIAGFSEVLRGAKGTKEGSLIPVRA